MLDETTKSQMANPMLRNLVRDVLIAKAMKDVEAYPQYKEESFRKMSLAFGRRKVTTKMGVALDRFEPVLVDTNSISFSNGRRFVTIWSNSNKVHTSVPVAALEMV